MPCPICKSKETRFFAQKDKYVFNRCSLCKTIYLKRQPTLSQLNEYYSKKFSYRDGVINEMIIRKRSVHILKRIKKLVPEAKTLCDVGSGFGYFLDEAKKWGYRTQGIEPSRELAIHAKKKYDLRVYLGNLSQYANNVDVRFDVVTCIHVIEHVTYPKGFIASLLQLVKPGGILFLETPNSDSHLLYVEKEDYTFLIPPEHVWLFSRKSIDVLLPLNSEIISINTYSYSEHLMGILKRIILPNKIINITTNNKTNRQINKATNLKKIALRKKLSYYLLDKGIAPLFTGMLNLYHKGSILELYIKKK